MKRLTVAAAALAAGLFTVVAHSQAESDRFLARHGLVKAMGVEKSKAPKAAPAKAKLQAASAKAGKKPTNKKTSKKVRTGRKGVSVDGTTTASISGKRPELKATARKGVFNIFGGALTKVEETDKVVEKVTTVTRTTGYSALVSQYAAAYGVPASLAHAVITVESNYRPNMLGSAGEVGLMQIKPATARMMGYSGGAKGLFNPETNIKFGMKYLGMAHDLAGGDTCGTILRYNAGHGARRMNPVSAAYCSKVKGLL